MDKNKPIISVQNLVKEYHIAKRGQGLGSSIKYLLSRQYSTIKAVDSISFDIYPGEIVGYIGRNGAGKSTTIKLLTGILVPTLGQVVVNGIIPYQNRSANGKNIGVVFGQRTQLKWDLPVIESFRLLKEIYQIPNTTYRKNLDLFSEIMGLGNLLSQPVRKLSLGQRMKCDLAASFLHNPKVIYLDEPTIGLDIFIKDSIRQFIKMINTELGTTIILTTHDLDDINSVCERSIIVDSGKIIYDGSLDEIKKRFNRYKFISFDIRNDLEEQNYLPFLSPSVELQMRNQRHLKLRIDRMQVSSSDVIKSVMNFCDVQDVNIEEMSIEDIVKYVYQDKSI